jgi:pSer/pThr/pTyr-binding forkhead associated (FHA) protein
LEVTLIVLEGRHRGQKIVLPRTQFVVGRDDSCHLRPLSTDVSKFHCAIARLGDRILLRDLRSKNGTFLNDRRVSGTRRVAHGDILRVGPLKFLFQLAPVSELEPSDSNSGWLLRAPDEGGYKVLDPGADTTILEGPLPAPNSLGTASSPPGSTDEANVIAGRFLREYLATRKRAQK